MEEMLEPHWNLQRKEPLQSSSRIDSLKFGGALVSLVGAESVAAVEASAVETEPAEPPLAGARPGSPHQEAQALCVGEGGQGQEEERQNESDVHDLKINQRMLNQSNIILTKL